MGRAFTLSETDAHLHFMAINEQPPTLFIMLLMMMFCVHGKVVAFPVEQKRGSIQYKQLLPFVVLPPVT
jgi:hypothetical protein